MAGRKKAGSGNSGAAIDRPLPVNAKQGIWNRVMKYKSLLLIVSFACSFFSSRSIAIADDGRPNVVILFSDDAGYADFGFQPAVRPEMKSLTPQIDSIARDGVRFSSAYVSGAVCSPSRAGLMTGRYQQRFGHERNIPPGYMEGGLPLDETFFIKRIQPQGYRCGLVGKWHLGYPESYQPTSRGFDWFYGMLQGSRSYFPLKENPPHRIFLENMSPTAEGGYTTDRIGEAACRFIAESRTQPFFLFVSFTAPHGPLQPKPEIEARLDSIRQERRRKYAGLLVSLDENVGRILNALDTAGVAGNTLVIFTNDNGGQTQTGANNSPLRGRKGQLWEGGIRVPMAMRWPGKIRAGTVIDDPVTTLDFAPTVIRIAGAEIESTWNLDGVDLTDRLTGQVAQLESRDLFWRSSGSKGPVAMRSGKWKVVFNRGENGAGPELFDLSADIGEKNNLAESNGQQLQQMLTHMADWESGLIEPLWGGGKQAGAKDE
jgi:arylsulfatase A-like enzyme